MSDQPKIHQQSLKIPKSILITAKLLEVTSSKLAMKFAAKLFTSPVKYKLPKREIEMDKNSLQQNVTISSIEKEIVVYSYGKSDKKVLLVHGWSGRGTQLVKIADEMLKLGYTTISFDAPAHGKSPGKTSNMTEFIASILELEKNFGPFEFAIGHSLGGMSILNSIKRGLKVKKAVIIGSGDIVEDIMDDFVEKLGMNIAISKKMKASFEKKIGETMDSFSAYVAAKEVSIPVLVLHDKDDEDVPVKAAYHINENLKESELVITEGLGHRKILGDAKVIKKITDFLK
ncbi:pimeloyl-ACP methyl ester carboxylesterase [Flavobacterium endophyticum]|uniref:Pimeloyl-ACP methyl ester carboxylesterase n=1 Tax=Flavobacterium endophyticum TaxID=1540163 RepID=A0A495M8I8_9FLAO|nr:alpha/beta hydrolase [Flavobacterium endophyticum]RKS20569.1 pimeloyl-ACP methyl ester carboxylesterase [Flavobacterium endophyticum]